MTRAQLPASYNRDYNHGWRYSQRETATLDHLDHIRASKATYDGYLDYAASREKWHMRECRLAGGCSEHIWS